MYEISRSKLNKVADLVSYVIDHITQFQSDLHHDREVNLKLGDVIKHITQSCHPTLELQDRSCHSEVE